MTTEPPVCPECGGRYLRVSAGAVCENGCGKIVQTREIVQQAEPIELRGPRDFAQIPKHLRALREMEDAEG